MLGVEALLPGVEPGDAGLQRGEVLLGALGTGDGGGAGLGEATDLLLGGRGPAAQPVDLAVQAGQPLPPVGRSALEAGDEALLLAVRLLGGLPLAQGPVQLGPGGLDLGGDLVLLGAHPGGLRLELVRVAALRDLGL